MPHAMWFFRTGLKVPMHHLMPPGYNTADSVLRTIRGRQAAGVKNFWELSYDELIDQGYIVVGSPQTVIEKYAQQAEEYGLGMAVSAGGHLGSMPHWMVQKNMYLMAEQVMPAFRAPDGKPTHARLGGPRTLSEIAATTAAPKTQPVIRLANGTDVPTALAHLPEVADTADTRVPGTVSGNGRAPSPAAG
jgi:hypothetical protein